MDGPNGDTIGTPSIYLWNLLLLNIKNDSLVDTLNKLRKSSLIF